MSIMFVLSILLFPSTLPLVLCVDDLPIVKSGCALQLSKVTAQVSWSGGVTGHVPQMGRAADLAPPPTP